jgi:hypothetical protein
MNNQSVILSRPTEGEGVSHQAERSGAELTSPRGACRKDLGPPIFRRRDLSGSHSLLQGHFQSWDFGERFEKAFFVGEHFSGRRFSGRRFSGRRFLGGHYGR